MAGNVNRVFSSVFFCQRLFFLETATDRFLERVHREIQTPLAAIESCN